MNNEFKVGFEKIAGPLGFILDKLGFGDKSGFSSEDQADITGEVYDMVDTFITKNGIKDFALKNKIIREVDHILVNLKGPIAKTNTAIADDVVNKAIGKVNGGLKKTAGLFGALDDLARAAKNMSDDGAEVIHKFDPEQLKKILEATDKLKPSIKPIHLLGASVLAGAGFPIGQYIGNRAKDVTEAVLDAPVRVGESIARNMPQRPKSNSPYIYAP